MLTLEQVRKENAGEAPPKGFKAWFTKNKGVVLIGGGLVIATAGFLTYKAVFKKKSAITSGSMSSPSGNAASNDLSGVNIPSVEFD